MTKENNEEHSTIKKIALDAWDEAQKASGALSKHLKEKDISYVLYPAMIFILVSIFYGLMSLQGVPVNYYTSLGAMFVSGIGLIAMIIYHMYKKQSSE